MSLQIVQNFTHMTTELTVSIDCTSFFSLLRSVKIRADVANNKGFSQLSKSPLEPIQGAWTIVND